MYTGTQLPGQTPPTRRRPGGRWVAVAAAVAVAVTAGGVLMAVGGGDPAPTTEADRTGRSRSRAGPDRPPAPGPAVPGPEGTAGADGPRRPRVPGQVRARHGRHAAGAGSRAPPAATVQWLWPFADPADVGRWQRAYRQGGHQPWHLDAGDDRARVRRLPRLRRASTGWCGPQWTVGRVRRRRLRAAGRQPAHRGGRAPGQDRYRRDAPWEVVGTRDTTLTLDRPAYGSTVASPMTVGGRITGVDERVVVTLHAQSGDLQAAPAAVPAGGSRSPWSAPVRFSSGAGRTVTVAAATGGHVAAVERFAVTGVRTGP